MNLPFNLGRNNPDDVANQLILSALDQSLTLWIWSRLNVVPETPETDFDPNADTEIWASTAQHFVEKTNLQRVGQVFGRQKDKTRLNRVNKMGAQAKSMIQETGQETIWQHGTKKLWVIGKHRGEHTDLNAGGSH